MTTCRFLIVVFALLAVIQSAPVYAQPLQFEGIAFSRNYFVSASTASEVLEGLEQWGEYDQALAWSREKLGDDPSVRKRIESEKKALMNLTSSYMLPTDTFPMTQRAEGDIFGDGKTQRLIMYCRKKGRSIVRPDVYGFPLPVFLRVVSGTATVSDLRVDGECAPNVGIFSVPGANLVEIEVLGRGVWKEYFKWNTGSLMPVVLVDAQGKESRIAAGKGGGASWWVDGFFENGGRQFVRIQGEIDAAGIRKETKTMYSWDGEKYRFKND